MPAPTTRPSFLCPGSLGSRVSGVHAWSWHSHTLPLPSSKTKGALANTALMPGECLLSPRWSWTGFIQAPALPQPCPGSWNARQCVLTLEGRLDPGSSSFSSPCSRSRSCLTITPGAEESVPLHPGKRRDVLLAWESFPSFTVIACNNILHIPFHPTADAFSR